MPAKELEISKKPFLRFEERKAISGTVGGIHGGGLRRSPRPRPEPPGQAEGRHRPEAATRAETAGPGQPWGNPQPGAGLGGKWAGHGAGSGIHGAGLRRSHGQPATSRPGRRSAPPGGHAKGRNRHPADAAAPFAARPVKSEYFPHSTCDQREVSRILSISKIYLFR